MDSDSGSDSQYPRHKSSILSRDNWEDWFYERESYFAAKSIFFVTRQTETEYAWSETKGWNEKKRAKYDKASGKVRYYIGRSISEIDQKLVREFSSAKEIWEGLKAKYSRIQPQKTRETLKKLTAYELPPDTSIEAAWAELQEMRRQIKAALPRWDVADAELFNYLLWGLPSEYSATVAALTAQPHLDFADKFLILQDQQDRLAAAASTFNAAYAAKTAAKTHNKTPRRRKAKKQCFLCGAAHWVRQCTVWKDLSTLAQTARNAVRRPRKPKPKSDSSDKKVRRTDQKSSKRAAKEDSPKSPAKPCTTDSVSHTLTPPVRLRGEKKSVRKDKAPHDHKDKTCREGERRTQGEGEKHEDTASRCRCMDCKQERSELREWKRVLRDSVRSAGLL
jgi:gag-polypeptide of LTR copia-type